MRLNAITTAVYLLWLQQISVAKPLLKSRSSLQVPLEDLDSAHHQRTASKQLHGRFLHITDLHPDPHYKALSSTDEDDACHRGKGTAGTYGAETSDCDTPHALIDATFEWIKENLKDDIDFVVWTGDSARHDSDEQIPRVQQEVLDSNKRIANKFLEVFGKDGELSIPVVSTFGNNDILPHNILLSGPNKWLSTYSDIWDKFIPEEQRHGFRRGGWYYVEVIPKKLAIFSLNTLYFFSHNAAVDGCALRSEPGYEHMEWLRIQLQFMRERGMKVMLTGHVPPARTDSKQLWDETCWQMYTLWLRQYRDIIVGGLFGHMNIDHFMLHDTKDIDLLLFSGESTSPPRALMDDEFTINSAGDYLEELRENWSNLPNPSVAFEDLSEEEFDVDMEAIGKDQKQGNDKQDTRKKALKEIGGPWGERFQVTQVGPSVVPNYFPTLRVLEYNITGLDKSITWSKALAKRGEEVDWMDQDGVTTDDEVDGSEDVSVEKKGKKDKKKRPKKKPSNPDLIVPTPPSKSAPPGPAYSPQTLTLLGYTQYYANLTYINNLDLAKPSASGNDIDAEKWRKGKHGDKVPLDKDPNPKAFQYQVEYDTFTDPIYKLQDMTVRSYLKLAHRIGQYEPEKGDRVSDGELWQDSADEEDTQLLTIEDDVDVENDDEMEIENKKGKKHKHKGKGKKHRKQKEKNRVWLRFIKRAFVGTLDEDELNSFSHEFDVDNEDTEGWLEEESHASEL
ncbi:Endopolyphosphatase [Clarireedia jacksonii]